MNTTLGSMTTPNRLAKFDKNFVKVKDTVVLTSPKKFTKESNPYIKKLTGWNGVDRNRVSNTMLSHDAMSIMN